MIIGRSGHFKKQYKKLPKEVQERVDKAIELLTADSRHPSLYNKKIQGTDQIWEIRVTQNYRITYEKVAGGIFLRRVGTHNILNQP